MDKSTNQSFKILIVAAEASSALYAQRLLEKWNKQGLSYESFGIGSRKMESLGFRCIGYAEDLAVMGLVEVLKHYKEIRKVFYDLIKEADKEKPNLVLLLDYPDFNLRLAKKLKNKGLPIYYYISPQVWIWRQKRIHFIKKYIDKMLVLFPFEVDFYKRFNMDVEFVGHPLLDELKDSYFDKAAINKKKVSLGINPTAKVLALMPGSRQSELDQHLNVQIETAQVLLEKNPNLEILLLIAPNLLKEEIKKRINSDLKIHLIQDEPFEMVSLADVVLCASGTATLTVGLMEKPMAIMYKIKALSLFLFRFIMKMPEFFGIVNIIQQKKVAEEFFQEDANPKKMAYYLNHLLNDNSAYQERVKDLKELKNLLGSKGGTDKVSEIILNKIFNHK